MRINRPCLRFALPPLTLLLISLSVRERCSFESRDLFPRDRVATVEEHERDRHFFAAFLGCLEFPTPLSLSLSNSLSPSFVGCFVSGRGKLFFHCAVFWGRSAAKAAAAATTNIHATSNRPHDQTPQTQRVASLAFLRYTSAQAAGELLPDRESNTLPHV